jgi:hypothetical protein
MISYPEVETMKFILEVWNKITGSVINVIIFNNTFSVSDLKSHDIIYYNIKIALTFHLVSTLFTLCEAEILILIFCNCNMHSMKY